MIRTSKKFELIGMCLVIILSYGCGKKESDQQAQSTEQSPAGSAASTKSQAETPPAVNPPDLNAQLADAGAKNREALLQMNQGKVVEPVDIGTMKEMLPAELLGMTRSNTSVEQNQMMGVNIAQAQADYKAANDDEGSIHVMIMDAGSLSGPMRIGLTGWTMTQYNRETDDGYEKTTTYKGHKAVEEYNTPNRRGVLRVFVANRFVVEMTGSQTTIETVKQAMDKIDIKKMEALASK